MKTSIATVTVAGNFREKVEAIAQAGFDGIEIFEQDFLTYEGSPREAAQMVRDVGLDILLFQPFRDFEGLPQPLRQRAFARAEHKFDLMEELGTDLILVCSSTHPEALGGIDRTADDLRELGERAARRGLRIGYEALAWGRHVNDHRDAWEAVRRADYPNVGLILDSFHTLGRGLDPDTIRRIPGDRIFFVQLADAPAIEMDLLYWSRHFRNMPGEGDLDVTRFMRAIMATGYDGPLSLEIFNDQFRAGLPRLVAADGYRSLVSLMDDVRRAEPALPTTLPPFAPPATVEAVEFIEFASSPGEAPALAQLLSATGFAKVGAHVSKDVTLWRQGAINILINTETTGLAHTTFVNHGTTISEIGLVVADAAAVKGRATALGAEDVPYPVKTGELDIPAVSGVGGSVLRLLDRGSDLKNLWDVDFRVTDAAHPDAGLCRIDHVAQTVPYDELLSWALYYTSIFGARKAAMVDIADPHGLVRSQALSSGALRVTLNGAETRGTLAGQFITDSLGASLQHIAFATQDIFTTAERLRAGGFPVLPIGANYYADLQARLGLDDARTDALRSRNLLYDRDATGEFYQLFSVPRTDGFFLEVVQRLGGYDGYGAANAPFRIAAMKRLRRPPGMPSR